MWESSRDKLHIDAEELWFPGVYGQPVPKPTDIKKWEEGKCYFLLDISVPRLKADRMLQDLSCIALKHAQSSVQQRITLKPNSRGENRAPIVFQYDKEGEYLSWALLLREAPPTPASDEAEDSDDDSSESSIPRVDAGAPTTPHPRFVPTEGRQEGDNRQRQQDIINAWVDDPDTPIAEEQRYTLELYLQLTDDERVYVTELQRCYG